LFNWESNSLSGRTGHDRYTNLGIER